MSTKAELFIDPKEVEVAHLQSGSISPTGTIGANYCVLSDKRLYFKGTVVGGMQGRVANSESTINLESINGTAFYVIKNIAMLLFSLLFLLGGAGCYAYSMAEKAEILSTVGLVVAGFGLLFLLLFFVVRRKIVHVAYCGGELDMLCNFSTVKTMRAFCNAIHNAADKARANARKESEAVPAMPKLEPVAVVEQPAEEKVEEPAQL